MATLKRKVIGNTSKQSTRLQLGHGESISREYITLARGVFRGKKEMLSTGFPISFLYHDLRRDLWALFSWWEYIKVGKAMASTGASSKQKEPPPLLDPIPFSSLCDRCQ